VGGGSELSDFICTVVMTGARIAQSLGCEVDGTGFDFHRDKRYLYSVIIFIFCTLWQGVACGGGSELN